MRHDKLVRDLIPEIISAELGAESFTAHVATDEEFKRLLVKKLHEETDEFGQDGSIEELADLFEVFYAIMDEWGYRWTDLKKAMQKKARERGRFKKRIVLEEVTD